MQHDARVSKAGLGRLCKTMERDGVPTHYSRATQYRARKALCGQDSPFGKLVYQIPLRQKKKYVRLGALNIPIQSPQAAVWHAARNSECISEFLSAAPPSSMDSPWRIILYQDGVDPSDGLAKNHSRKTNAFYWTFAELGPSALWHEEVWFTITLARAFTTRRMVSGLPQLTSLILDAFFSADHSFKNGCKITLASGRELTIFADLGIVLADEPALKEMYNNKGHAGSKCCMLCLNAVQHKRPGGAPGLWQSCDNLLSIAEPCVEKFIPQTDETLVAIVRRLKDYKSRLNKTQLQKKELALGFNYTRYDCIDRAPALGSLTASKVMYDWVHSFICDGAVDSEFGQLMWTLRRAKSRCTYAELRQYCNAWRWPKYFGSSFAARLFSETAAENNYDKKSFSSTASEFLSLAPVLYCFMLRVTMKRHAADADLKLKLKSFCTGLQIVLMLMWMKYSPLDPTALSKFIKNYISLHLEAYGKDTVRPKHHYCSWRLFHS